jgi:hypothetical protein
MYPVFSGYMAAAHEAEIARRAAHRSLRPKRDRTPWRARLGARMVRRGARLMGAPVGPILRAAGIVELR